jgi:hypothetical protein
VYNQVTDVELTAIPQPGYLFAGWSGHLGGVVNPETLTVDSDKDVTATFVEEPAGGGAVVYEETRTGGAVSSDVVSTETELTAASGNLYLAAVSTKPHVEVTSVSGLGLIWTPVAAQCAGRSQTGVSVWMARGTPTGNGTVTAVLEKSPQNAVIAVSRYSGVDPVNPVGAVLSGNTNGSGGTCSGGSDNNSYSFDFTTTTDGAVIYGAVAKRHKAHTAGAGYTERAEVSMGSGGSVAGLSAYDQTIAAASVTTLDGTFSGSVDWAVIGLEIKPGSVSAASAKIASLGQSLNSLNKSGDESDEEILALPTALTLRPNYPNPFNMETTIEYALPENTPVRLVVYNILGQQVRKLVDENQAAGYKRITWNGRDDFGSEVGSGVYFIRFLAGQQQIIGRMILQK